MLSISIKNFRQIEEFYMTVEMEKPTLITGNSGCGKTTIIEAIRWCLYGKLTDFRRKDGSQALVVLTWPDMVISRVSQKLGLSVQLQYGYADHPEQFIESIFGTENMFSSVCLVEQKSTSLLLKSNAATTLSELIFSEGDVNDPDFIIGKIDDALIPINIRILQLTQQLQDLQLQISEKTERIFEVRRALEDHPTVTFDITNQIEACVTIHTLIAALTDYNIQFAQWEMKDTDTKILHAKIASELADVRRKIGVEIDRLEKLKCFDISEIAVQKDAMQVLSRLNIDLAYFMANIDVYDVFMLSGGFARIEQIERATMRNKELKAQHVEYEKQLVEHQRYTDYLEKFDAYLKAKQAYDEIYQRYVEISNINAAAKRNYDDAILAYRRHIKEMQIKEECVRELNALLSLPTATHPGEPPMRVKINRALVCPHCVHEFYETTDGTLCRDRIDNENEIIAYETALKTYYAYQGILSKISTLKMKIDSIDATVTPSAFIEQPKLTVVDLPILPPLPPSRPSEVRACSVGNKPDDVTQIHPVDMDFYNIYAKNKNIICKFSEIQAYVEMIYQLKKSISKHGDLRHVDISPRDYSLWDSEKELIRRMIELESILGTLPPVRPTPMSEQQLYEILAKITMLDATAREIDAIDGKIRAVNSELIQLTENVDLCNKSKRHVEHSRVLYVESFLVKVIKITNDILSQLFRYTVKFELMHDFSKTKNGLKTRLTWSIALKDHVHSSLSTLSGGEKDKLSFAITLAFAICRNVRILAFDEIFTSMEEESRSLCIKVLKTYKLTTLLISHLHISELEFVHIES